MKAEQKNLLRVAGTLTAISLVVAGLLGGVNELTKDNIRAENQKNTERALSQVVTSKDCAFVPLAVSDDMASAARESGAGARLSEAYEVQVNGETTGYAFKVIAGGSQGDIQMIVGVDADDAVTGVSVVQHAETSNIGSKVMENVNGVLDQFKGMSGAGTLEVGENVDAISGATISSRGVTHGVNAALAAAEAMH